MSKMSVKSISSTIAKNKFGQVLEDVTQNDVRYIIERHGIAKAVIISIEDLTNLLSDEEDRERIKKIVNEVRPQYEIGRPVNVEMTQEESSEKE